MASETRINLTVDCVFTLLDRDDDPQKSSYEKLADIEDRTYTRRHRYVAEGLIIDPSGRGLENCPEAASQAFEKVEAQKAMDIATYNGNDMIVLSTVYGALNYGKCTSKTF